MDEIIHASAYSIAPTTLVRNNKLAPLARLLYLEISALCSSRGYCWASNNHLADCFGIDKRSVSRHISALEKGGYISIEVKRDSATKQVTQRRIWLGDRAMWEKINGAENDETDVQTPIDNFVATSRQKCDDPIDKNVAVYIRKNNIRVNNNPIAPKDVLEFVRQYANGNSDLLDAFYGLLENRFKMKKQVHTLRTLNGIIGNLESLARGDDAQKIKLLDAATTHNWLTVYAEKTQTPQSAPRRLKTGDIDEC